MEEILFLVCWEVLLWMGVDFWQMVFLHLLKWSYSVSVNVMYYIIGFQMLNQPCILGINPNLVVVY